LLERPKQKWLTTREALEYLRLKERHSLIRYEKMGLLRACRLPGKDKKGHKRYLISDLDEFLKKRRG